MKYPKKHCKDILYQGFFLMLIPFFKLPWFDELPALDLLFNLLRVLAGGIVLLYVALHRRRISRAGLAFIALQISLLISTVINGRPIYDYVRDNFLQLSVFFLVSLLLERPRLYVRYVFQIAEILVYLNLFFMLTFPDGMYKTQLLGFYHNWLFGYKNQFLPFLLLFILVSALYSQTEKPSIRPYLLAGSVLFSLLLANTKTSFAAILIFVLLWVFIVHSSKRNWNPYVFFAASVAIFLGLVVFKGYQLADVLFHKPITFSGRTAFWGRITELIAEKPLFGWGVMSAQKSLELTKLKECTHAHNTILQYLYTGGGVSLIFYVLFLYCILKRLYMARNSFSSKILTAALFSLSIAALTEVYVSSLIPAVYAMSDRVEKYGYCDRKRMNLFQHSFTPLWEKGKACCAERIKRFREMYGGEPQPFVAALRDCWEIFKTEL